MEVKQKKMDTISLTPPPSPRLFLWGTRRILQELPKRIFKVNGHVIIFFSICSSVRPSVPLPPPPSVERCEP